MTSVWSFPSPQPATFMVDLTNIGSVVTVMIRLEITLGGCSILLHGSKPQWLPLDRADGIRPTRMLVLNLPLLLSRSFLIPTFSTKDDARKSISDSTSRCPKIYENA